MHASVLRRRARGVEPVPELGPACSPGACPTAPAGRCTACPPNWWRSAATAFIAGESSWREANRANSAAEITGSGTACRIASSIVQRPSPESST